MSEFVPGDVIFRDRTGGLPASTIVNGVRVQGVTATGDTWARKMVILAVLEDDFYLIRSKAPHTQFGKIRLNGEHGFEKIGEVENLKLELGENTIKSMLEAIREKEDERK